MSYLKYLWENGRPVLVIGFAMIILGLLFHVWSWFYYTFLATVLSVLFIGAYQQYKSLKKDGFF